MNSHQRCCIECGQVKQKEHDFPAVNDVNLVQPRYLRRCRSCYHRILRRIDIRERIRGSQWPHQGWSLGNRIQRPRSGLRKDWTSGEGGGA